MWKGYGLTLEIGEGSLPAALQECCIHIKALAPVAVRYNLPDNVSLSSVVYWFQCEPSCCFEKAITLRMHHCAKNEDKSRFCILKANYHCVQSSSFAFEKLEGDFSTRGQGSIKLNSFSLYGTGVEGSDEREYCSTVAYQYGCGLADIHFIVTWNIEPLLTVSTCSMVITCNCMLCSFSSDWHCQSYYPQQQFIKEHYKDQIQFQFSVVFELEKVVLKFSNKTENGWEILPLFNPVVSATRHTYRSLAKEGPWVVHLTLGSNS